MNRIGTALALGSCTDTDSQMRLVSMGDTAPTYRLEFGDRVIDAPNRSSTAGLKLGLYTWNRGTNQQVRIEGGSPTTSAPIQLRLVHSSLLLEANGLDVVQNPSKSGAASQTWELVAASSAISPARKTEFVNPGHPPRFDASGRIRHHAGNTPWTTMGF